MRITGSFRYSSYSNGSKLICRLGLARLNGVKQRDS
jgi:hypothetical protein